MKSISGKPMDPERKMTDYQIMILGGLQDRILYQGTVSAKEKNRRRKKKHHDELSRKRQRRQVRSDEMLAKWEKIKRGRSVQ